MLTRLILCLALMMAAGCSEEASPTSPDGVPLRVVVTVAPLAGLVEPIIGPGAELTVLMPPGTPVHGHELSPKDIAAMGRADVIVYVGLGLEPQVARFVATHPSANRTVVCFADVVGITVVGGSHEEGGHEEGGHGEGGHGEGGEGVIDPHLWLDPGLVRELIPAVVTAVKQAQEHRGVLDEAERGRIERAGDELLARLDALDQEYRSRLGPFSGESIVTHHAAWSRLAGRYGLEVVSVIRPVEAGEPTPGAVAGAVGAIREHGAKAVFVEPQFGPAEADRIAGAAGVRVEQLDPIGDGDWFAMMRANLDALVRGLGGPGYTGNDG